MPVRFCQECGAPVQEQLLGGRMRPNCQGCGYIHYGLHSIGVGGLVVIEDRVLLIQRAQNPGKGRWTIPGGYVENDEPCDEAVVREVAEETGIETAVDHLFAVRHRVTSADSNVYLVFKLRPVGGALTSDFDPEEIAQVGFYSEAEMENLSNLAEFTRELIRIANRRPDHGLPAYDMPSMVAPGWTFYASGGNSHAAGERKS